MAMTFVRPEPYKGKMYDNSTLFGVRVMVVGASHYCGKFDQQTKCTSECKSYGKYWNDCGQYFGERCEKFTINVIRRYLGKDLSSKAGGWKRTFTQFLKSLFKSREASTDDCRKVVAHLVFTEYLQGAEGRDASDKDNKAFTDDRHYKALMENIVKYRPDVVVVWGDRVWAQIEKHREDTIGNHRVRFVKISHPSQRGYYKTEPQKQFEAAGMKLIGKDDLLKDGE